MLCLFTISILVISKNYITSSVIICVNKMCKYAVIQSYSVWRDITWWIYIKCTAGEQVSVLAVYWPYQENFCFYLPLPYAYSERPAIHYIGLCMLCVEMGYEQPAEYHAVNTPVTNRSQGLVNKSNLTVLTVLPRWLQRADLASWCYPVNMRHGPVLAVMYDVSPTLAQQLANVSWLKHETLARILGSWWNRGLETEWTVGVMEDSEPTL